MMDQSNDRTAVDGDRRDLPLVTCIMPTHNRRRFVPRAIEYFLRQSYPNRELIVIDDGTDRVEDLIPEMPGIEYHAVGRKLTVGEKRNIAIERGRGEIVMHWDDDDWMGSTRIEYQTRALLHAGAGICGTSRALFCDLRDGRLWEYRYPPNARRWLCGGTLCYRRALWERRRFEHVSIGEDTRFIWSVPAGAMLDLPEIRLYIATVHPRNTSRKPLAGARWHAWRGEGAEEIMGDDWPFYETMLSTTTASVG